MNARVLLLPFFVAAVVSGCAADTNAIVDTFRYAISRGGGDAAPRLNPEFSYLRLTIDGRVAYLARGSIDPGPGGPVEVWYSGGREVIRLQNGRVAGAVGATTEWRNVVFPDLPSWADLAKRREYRWERVRDVMPGYRFGIVETLGLRVVAPPAKTALLGIRADRLTWFEEAQVSADPKASGLEPLPPARYAVALAEGGAEQVVYGEQCLSADFCFSWQRWSPQASSSNDKK